MSLLPNFTWARDCFHSAHLSIADLRYEWVQSLCLMLAFGAIFAPLFILLGLKEGIIGTMLDRLRTDPDSLVVTPSAPLTIPLDDEWLMKLREHAAYVVASPTAYLMLDVPELDEQVNVFPTDDEEPLLREHKISIGSGITHIVLSERLAKRCNKHVGDTIVIELIRSTGREEHYELTFSIAGILPQSGGVVNKIWMSKELFSKIYQWRAGQSLPEFGLPGAKSSLSPEYDGVLAIAAQVPTQEEYQGIIAGKSSFSQLPEPVLETGWITPAGQQVMLWETVGSRVFASDVVSLVNQYNNLGYEVEAVPFLNKLMVRLIFAKKDIALTVTLLPESMEPRSLSSMQVDRPVVWMNPQDLGYIDQCIPGSMQLDLDINTQANTIPIVACPNALLLQGFLAADHEFAGKMRAAQREGAIYRADSGYFEVTDHGIRYFRAYASSLAGVEDLAAFIQNEGENRASQALSNPVSKLAEVRKILRLSYYFEQLYRLIVAVSGISCFFAVIANVHAGIQRKRRDLAMLQLMGLHTFALFLNPNVKSITLVIGGILLSVLAYMGFSHVGAMIMVDHTDSLTRLPISHAALLIGGILVTTVIASVLAAISVLRIDPGEFIRE